MIDEGGEEYSRLSLSRLLKRLYPGKKEEKKVRI